MEFLDEDFVLDGFLGGLFGFAIVIGIIFIIFAVAIYVFQGLALSKLAKKNNIPNPWLAWIPTGNMYLLGTLGFEVYAPQDKKNQSFKWILFGCSVASIVLSDSSMSSIASLVVTIFSTWSYYYIFAKINSKNCILYTVLTAILSIGGILLFFETRKINDQNSKTQQSSKFCANCGNKLNENSQFCSKCGNKIG